MQEQENLLVSIRKDEDNMWPFVAVAVAMTTHFSRLIFGNQEAHGLWQLVNFSEGL